jgi:formylglycine-generating enzyme required for sulfatase activity
VVSERSATPPRLFISYRTEDSLAVATALARDLERLLTGEIFLDHRSIDAGDAWPDRLRQAVEAADVVLLLIGQRWLTAQTTDGIRRLDDPDDWVRLEIEAALRAKRRLIPVLVDGARPLDRRAFRTVPQIADLADLQALPLATEEWDSHLEALVALLVRSGFRRRISTDPFEVPRGSTTQSGPPIVPVEYLAWLQSTKCARVDLFGLEPKHGSAAKLYTIYVPLTTAPGAEDLDEDGHSRGKKRSSRHVGMSERGRELPTLLLDRLAKESLYVPGATGSGKSTFCRWVTWLACEGRLPSALVVDPPERYRETWPAAFANRLPAFVRLREFFPALPPRPGARDLARADFEASLAEWLEVNTEGLSSDIFRRHLAQGSTLLVLDGVDEVPVAAGEGNALWSPRALLVSGLANSCGTWTTAGNRVLITSRPYGLTAGDAGSLGIATAPVHDLDPPLRELLVRRWFQQLRPGTDGESFADGLIAHLRENAWLEPLSVNPLLLTGMCIVYDEGGRLPQDKHDLYARIVNTVLNSRYRDNVAEREKARYRLQAIAYGMHAGRGAGERRASPAAEASLGEIDGILSDYLEKSRSKEEGTVAVVAAREELLSLSGLFLGRGEGKAGFYHLSFQEFLAGQRVADVEDDVFPVFHARAESPEWHNTLSLLFAGLTRERAARLVTKLVAEFSKDKSPHQACLQTVVADCLDILHARGVRMDEATENSCREVFQSTMVSRAPAAVRCRFGSTLGRISDPRFHDEHAWCLPKNPPLGFIEIPAGPFTMGCDKARDSDAHDDETPQHEVTLPTYYFARWPVTVAQFRAFIEDVKFTPKDPDCLNGVPNHPVVKVSWPEALAYCRWLTETLRASNKTPEPLATLLRKGDDGRGPWQVTLPSEAEWEKAARGIDGRIYPWGNNPDRNRANYADTGIGGTSAVGCFPAGASPYGVEELSGNVWDWTRSLWGKDFGYPYKPSVSRENLDAPDDVRRVVRGGSFNYSRRLVRAAYRNWCSPVSRFNRVGFRLVVSPFSSEL